MRTTTARGSSAVWAGRGDGWRRAGVTWLLVTALGLTLCASSASAATSSTGQCRLTLPVTVRRASADSAASSSYTSSSGTASCSAGLGPWLMGGGGGWSAGHGSLSVSTTALPGACALTRVIGSFWAEVPRLAWLGPPLVTMIGSFGSHHVDGLIGLTGSGKLIPTRESPQRASFAFTGTATIAPSHGQSCEAKEWSGRLTLVLAERPT